jgi:predicted RNA-binding Zn ribbon-like protein
MSEVTGEPLPLELANTLHGRFGGRDGLRTVAQLAEWLGRMRPRLETPLTEQDLHGVEPGQLALARDLRGCVRELAASGTAPRSAVIDRLNRLARTAPRWRELRWNGELYAEARTSAPPVTAAICEVADAAVELLSGPRRDDVRQCEAPGCVLLFLRTHPRRAWCSPGCGNRVRAARHYERMRKR